MIKVWIVKEYTDFEVIECLRERKSYVVRYLSDKYLPMIRFMVLKMGGTTEDARDIFQEGLMVMIEKLDDRNFSLSCKFKTLLYSICENMWKMSLKKKQSAANYLSRARVINEEEDISESIDNALCREIFQDVYNSLDPVGKKILSLYWEDVSPQDIALKLGYSYGYIRKKKCEVQAELIEKVKRHPDYLKIVNSGIIAESVVF